MRRIFLCFLILLSYNILAQDGLKGEYFAGKNFNRQVATRLDPQLNFNWVNVPPIKGLSTSDYSIRWTGRLNAPLSGEYEFSAVVDDGIRLWVGGVKLIDDWGPNNHKSINSSIIMEEGKQYDIRVEYYNGILEGQLLLMWKLPPDQTGRINSKRPQVIGSGFLKPPSDFMIKPAVPVAIPIAEKSAPASKPEPKPDPKPESKIEEPKPVIKPLPPTIPPADTLEKYLPKDVLFEPGDYEILESSFPQLNKLTAFLVRNPRLLLEIHGHTDVTGDPEINLQLSKDRASEVATYLSNKGVNSSRITAKGFGASKPKYGQAKNQIYARNRRVEFYIK